VVEELGQLVLVGCNGPFRGRAFPIARFPCSVGRLPDNDIPVAGDACASGRHCRIDAVGGKLWLEDVGSKNGTYHNGLRITGKEELIPGKSILCVGRARFMLLPAADAAGDGFVKGTQSIMIAGSVIIPGALAGRRAEEALLVMDLCDSTGLARKHGEEAVCRCVTLLTQVAEAGQAGPSILFLKCTGDGFFATFPGPGPALQTAGGLLQWLGRHPADLGVPDLGIRLALHHGEVQTDQTGDRLGLAANLVFRLQAAKDQDRVEPARDSTALPERNRILLTKAAVERLAEEDRRRTRLLGAFRFKGFDAAFDVYLWG